MNKSFIDYSSQRIGVDLKNDTVDKDGLFQQYQSIYDEACEVSNRFRIDSGNVRRIMIDTIGGQDQLWANV